MLSTHVVRDAKAQLKHNDSTTTSRIRDLTTMNPPTFFGSKVEENPQGFINEVLKVLDAYGCLLNK